MPLFSEAIKLKFPPYDSRENKLCADNIAKAAVKGTDKEESSFSCDDNNALDNLFNHPLVVMSMISGAFVGHMILTIYEKIFEE